MNPCVCDALHSTSSPSGSDSIPRRRRRRMPSVVRIALRAVGVRRRSRPAAPARSCGRGAPPRPACRHSGECGSVGGRSRRSRPARAARPRARRPGRGDRRRRRSRRPTALPRRPPAAALRRSALARRRLRPARSASATLDDAGQQVAHRGVVDGPSAPAFSSSDVGHRLPGVARRPRIGQQRGEAAPPAARASLSRSSNGTRRRRCAAAGVRHRRSPSCSRLLVLIEGDGVPSGRSNSSSLRSGWISEPSPSAVQPGRPARRASPCRPRPAAGTARPSSCSASPRDQLRRRRSGRQPMAAHQRLGQPGGDLQILGWSRASVFSASSRTVRHSGAGSRASAIARVLPRVRRRAPRRARRAGGSTATSAEIVLAHVGALRRVARRSAPAAPRGRNLPAVHPPFTAPLNLAGTMAPRNT